MRKAGRTYCDRCGKEMDGTDDYYKTTVELNKQSGHGDNELMVLCTRNDCGKWFFEHVRALKKHAREKAIKNHEDNIIKEYQEIVEKREKNG